MAYKVPDRILHRFQISLLSLRKAILFLYLLKHLPQTQNKCWKFQIDNKQIQPTHISIL